MRRHLVAGLAVALACAAPAGAASVSSGPLRATIGEHPWHLSFKQRGGRTLDEAPALALAFHTPAGWMHATEVLSMRHTSHGLVSQVATSDPAGRRLEVRLEAAGDGALFLRAKIAGDVDQTDVDATRIGFASPSSERFFGFGERSNAIDQRGHDVENYVSDGPWPAEDYGIAQAATPPQGFRPRDDATYYPVPWLLSSRGYGVLIDRDETSTFHLATDPKNAWSAEVQSHAIALRVFGGPTLAQVLRRFTAATGRQPPPAHAVAVRPVVPDRPAEHGPARGRGVLSVQAEAGRRARVRRRDAAALPALRRGSRQRGLRGRAGEVLPRSRARGPHVHQPDALPVLRAAVGPGGRCRRAAEDVAGRPATFDSFVGGGGPAGFSIEPVAQFDFTSDTGLDVYRGVLQRVLAAGHDGWMEDFGEYTPADAPHAVGDAPP